MALFIGTMKTYPLSDTKHFMQVNTQELDALRQPDLLFTKKQSV